MNSLTSAVFLLLGLAIGQVGAGGPKAAIITLIGLALLLLMIQELHRMGAFSGIRRPSRKHTKQREPDRPSNIPAITVDVLFHPHKQGEPCTEACGDLHKNREEVKP